MYMQCTYNVFKTCGLGAVYEPAGVKLSEGAAKMSSFTALVCSPSLRFAVAGSYTAQTTGRVKEYAV